MSEALDRDIEFLTAILTDVLERLGPPGHPRLCDRLLGLCRDGERDGFRAARELVAGLSLEDIRELIKTLTLRFHLRNQAEKVAIVRINRTRRREATAYQPRPESIAAAVSRLKSRGFSREDVSAIAERIDIQPTLTAHPTESRRRTLLRRQREITECLIALHEHAHDVVARRRMEKAIHQAVLLLYCTDEVRIERLSVLEEIERSLYFLTTAIWEAVPRVLRDLGDAVEQCYDRRPALPVMVRYRTWIGGDRDGNPLVTPAMTLESLRLHREAAVHLHQEKLAELTRLLSLSTRRVPVPSELTASVRPEQLANQVPEASMARLRHEPFRLKLLQMRSRLAGTIDDGDGAYDASTFAADLALMAESLRRMNLGEIVDASGLADLLLQAEVFGFHLAALDIRQHSAVHEQAVSELLAGAGVCPDYAVLPEDQKVDVLTHALEGAVVDRPAAGELSAPSDDVLEVLHIVAQARQRDPRAVGSYIISMANGVSDVLEVLWLMRVAGCADVDIVPLFETIEDLARAPELLQAMLAHPIYRDHVTGRGQFQEIMLGYSDSNKDGGYVMSGWLLHLAQSRLARVCGRPA